MRSARSSIAALLLGTAACAPGLRPAGVAPSPEYSTSPSRSYVSSYESALENGNALSDITAVTTSVDLAPVDATGVEPLVGAWDIAVVPYMTHERVAFYTELFGGARRESVAARLRRGTRYEPMIRAKLAAAGLPEDLYYLAFVESGFDPDAYSRAAAVGMWQFMTTTARGVGLRVDRWVDERRDPVRSTDAAIRYLRGLRTEFDGSLYLAAAAYNGGSGRVGRGLSQHAAALAGVEGDDRFFALASTGYLRKETHDYVPQIVAIALVAKSPEVRAMIGDPLPPLAYDSVRVAAGTALAAVAEAAPAPVDAVRELNGHLLRGATPPGEATWVRVPVGVEDGFAERLAAVPAERRVAFTRVETEEHGRLSAIAKRHGLTEEQVAAFNPGIRRNKRGLLVGGQTVLVPSRATLAAARAVPDPEIEIYGSSAPARPAAASKPAAPRTPRTHTVVAGDALERIARQHDVSVADLRRFNGLKSDVIRPGQTLALEAPAAKGKAKSAKAAPAKGRKS